MATRGGGAGALTAREERGAARRPATSTRAGRRAGLHGAVPPARTARRPDADEGRESEVRAPEEGKWQAVLSRACARLPRDCCRTLWAVYTRRARANHSDEYRL